MHKFNVFCILQTRNGLTQRRFVAVAAVARLLLGCHSPSSPWQTGEECMDGALGATRHCHIAAKTLSH